jgi:cobalt/nickel transport system permease protein
MHIPDGFLSPAILIITFIVTAVFWAIAFKKVSRSIDERMVPVMAVLTALFFAAMMVNYPIIGGTTAHLLGGAAIGIILGPWAGIISVSIILVLQCFLFADGGLTALGANTFNMGVVGVLIPIVIFVTFMKLSKGRNIYVAAFLAAFLGDTLSAVLAGLELGLSTSSFVYGISVAVPTMFLHHSVIGVIEGVVTAVLLAVIMKTRPDILEMSPTIKVLPSLASKIRLQVNEVLKI